MERKLFIKSTLIQYIHIQIIVFGSMNANLAFGKILLFELSKSVGIEML